MGNTIRTGTRMLSLSNGEMSVLVSVLTLAASRRAEQDWQRELAVWIALHDQGVFGSGMVGFELDDLGWTEATVERERRFLVEVIDAAAARTGWDVLDYQPPIDGVGETLAELRSMVVDYRAPQSAAERKWVWQQRAPETYERCEHCGVYLHIGGCVVCNDA